MLKKKKKEILPFATAWTDLERIMLCEISQSEKTSVILSHLYVESNEQNKLTKYKQRQIYMVQTDSCQRGGSLGYWIVEDEGIKQKKQTHIHIYNT